MGHLSGSLFRRERWRQTRASCGTLWPWAAGTRVVLIRAPVKQSTFYQIAVSLQRAKWISSLLVYRSNFIKSVGSTKANPSETCQREGLLLQQQVRAVVSPGPRRPGSPARAGQGQSVCLPPPAAVAAPSALWPPPSHFLSNPFHTLTLKSSAILATGWKFADRELLKGHRLRTSLFPLTHRLPYSWNLPTALQTKPHLLRKKECTFCIFKMGI